jgi:hypothetical protein
MSTGTRASRTVFAGGGHAHLHSLLRTKELIRQGFEVIFIGDGTGFAVYGLLVWRGRLSFMLKHRIDKRFVKGFQR